MKTNEEINECIALQKKYCDKSGAPHFAPSSGRCFNCNRNIYDDYVINGRDSKGITLESAEKELVTGCPHCNRSYCD